MGKPTITFIPSAMLIGTEIPSSRPVRVDAKIAPAVDAASVSTRIGSIWPNISGFAEPKPAITEDISR